MALMKALDIDRIALTHPRTGEEMQYRIRPYSVVQAAERDAMAEWRSRYSFMAEVHAFFQASEWESRLALHRMSALLHRQVAGAWHPVGMDWLLEQDHIALDCLRQELNRFEREVDPRMGRDVTQGDIDALVEHVKKNGELPPGLLQSCAPSTLSKYLLSLAARLAMSPISESSNGGTGE